MLGILLTILKIIGIILLTILLLVLGILLIVLLVPVRYHMEGEYGEQKWCRGKVTWFLRIVSIPISVNETGVDVKIKIFGKELKNASEKKPKKEKSKKAKKRKAANKAQSVPVKQDLSAELPEKGSTERENAKVQTDKKVLTEEKMISVAERAEDNPEPATEEKGMEGIISKIHGKIESIVKKVKEICRKIKDLLTKAEDLNEKKNKILDFFCEQEAFEAKNQAVTILKKLVRHILPYCIEGSVHFGMEYPDATGQAYAIISLFYDKYANTLDLEPDFNQKILEGKLEFWGRIRLVNLVYYAICLFRIKKLREFVSLIRNL